MTQIQVLPAIPQAVSSRCLLSGPPASAMFQHARLLPPFFSCLLVHVTDRVLFICTGNFYRSRFAEAVFNHLAEKQGLSWRAFSRGLAIHWAEGYLSPYTARALETRKIELRHTGPARTQLSVHDLENAQRQIALDRNEHYPMMREQFPDWADRIEYWHVADLPDCPSEVALPQIEDNVDALIIELSHRTDEPDHRS